MAELRHRQALGRLLQKVGGEAQVIQALEQPLVGPLGLGQHEAADAGVQGLAVFFFDQPIGGLLHAVMEEPERDLQPAVRHQPGELRLPRHPTVEKTVLFTLRDEQPRAQRGPQIRRDLRRAALGDDGQRLQLELKADARPQLEHLLGGRREPLQQLIQEHLLLETALLVALVQVKQFQ